MKNFSAFLISLNFLVSGLLTGQTIKFEKVYGGSAYDKGYSVIQTYDKGYAVAGASSSYGHGAMDAYLLKVDSSGVIQYHHAFGGINIDQAYSINETPDSGLIIAGYTNSFGNGGYDMYVIKTNLSGDTTWTHTYGGTDWDFAYSIKPTNDGGYILAGGTYSFGNGNEDMYLLKLNSSGDTVWTRTFGGINDDEVRSVIQTSDGGYIVTGNTKSFGDTDGDIYTLKIDSSGGVSWTYLYSQALTDEAYDIIESSAGMYIIGGRTNSIGSGNFDGLIVQVSLTGSYIFAGLYGGSNNDGFHAITLTPQGRFAMMGYTYTYGFGLGTNDYLLYIENPFNGFHSGTYGGNKMEEAHSVANTTDGGYIICGSSTSYSTLDHIYLIKADSNGVSSGTVINVVGIDNDLQANNSFDVYPNPANNNLFINLAGNHQEVVVLIRDVLGKECYSQKLNNPNNPIEINSSSLLNGIYLISIQLDKSISTKRIIIQH